ACGGGEPTGARGSSLSVTSTTPAASATDVPISTTVAATFSAALDPASFAAGVFTLSGGVTGTVAVSGPTATFTPSGDLSPGTTYTAAISTGAASATGETLGSAYDWSFKTATATVPPFSFPQSAGKLWLYSDTTTGSVCSQSGCNSSSFRGQRVLLAAGTVSWQGRTALQLRQYRFEGSDSFSVLSPLYVTQTQAGLDTWNGSAWGRILSSSGGSFTSNAFLIADGADYGAPSTMSTGQVTVPAGSYTVARTSLHYTDTGIYNPADIFVDRSESYADGVGLVAGGYSYSYDDNDPAGIDQSSTGTFKLMAMDAAVPYTFADEVEPNDALALPGAQIVTRGSIIHGDAAIGDASVIPVISGLSPQPLNPDSTGVAQLQDIYAVTLNGTGLVVDLGVEQPDQDVDLYLLANSRGEWVVLGAGLNPAGAAERVTLGTTTGTYYIGIQAWNKPAGGRSGYSLYVH
ncbi:MAG TPA: Ig-like domain-containing protein, partial [Gemmatimonadales bacterium]|nr:Ig-like domain-containing protein [Gemmatimonadales bacterium]